MKKVIAFLIYFLIAFEINICAEINTDAVFDNFMTYYYSNPAVEKVPQALEYFIFSDFYSTNFNKEFHAIDMIAYFFGSLAEKNPKLLREYEKIYDRITNKEKVFIHSIFSIYRDNETETFLQNKINQNPHLENAIKQLINEPFYGTKAFVKEVSNFNELDFLWVEFFVTGEQKPILKIIDVLAWEDLFRAKLKIWMHKQNSLSKGHILIDMLKDMGIIVDLNSLEINLANDLDCVFMHYLQSGEKKYAKKIKEILELSDEDFIRIGTKGAAFWSLQSNAQQHPVILRYLVEQIQSRKDKAVIECELIVNLATMKK